MTSKKQFFLNDDKHHSTVCLPFFRVGESRLEHEFHAGTKTVLVGVGLQSISFVQNKEEREETD